MTSTAPAGSKLVPRHSRRQVGAARHRSVLSLRRVLNDYVSHLSVFRSVSEIDAHQAVAELPGSTWKPIRLALTREQFSAADAGRFARTLGQFAASSQ